MVGEDEDRMTEGEEESGGEEKKHRSREDL
jgi:hypothetical protein